MTLNALALEIIAEQGDRQGDTGFITQVETWIKDDLVRINLRSRFRLLWKEFSFNTVAMTSTYSLPLDFRDPKYVRRVDTDDPIEFLNPIRLTKFNFDLEQTGNPRFCWYVDSAVVGTDFIKKLRIHPIPNGIFSINLPYYYYPQKGLLPATHISVPDEIILMLKSRVRMSIHKLDMDWPSYNAERGEYSEAVKDYEMSDRTTPSRDLVRGHNDLPKRAQRPTGRFRYPFEP